MNYTHSELGDALFLYHLRKLRYKLLPLSSGLVRKESLVVLLAEVVDDVVKRICCQNPNRLGTVNPLEGFAVTSDA